MLWLIVATFSLAVVYLSFATRIVGPVKWKGLPKMVLVALQKHVLPAQMTAPVKHVLLLILQKNFSQLSLVEFPRQGICLTLKQKIPLLFKVSTYMFLRVIGALKFLLILDHTLEL